MIEVQDYIESQYSLDMLHASLFNLSGERLKLFMTVIQKKLEQLESSSDAIAAEGQLATLRLVESITSNVIAQKQMSARKEAAATQFEEVVRFLHKVEDHGV